MIEVRDLTKDYGSRRAIDKLNFSISKGDVVGFLGPNGAGKSTTMKIITGFMAPSQGSASVAGFDVFENPLEVKKRIGYLPETPPVYGDMFVRDYLRYVAALKKVPHDKIEKCVDYAIEKTNLGDVQKRLIQHLSKGFKQRVGIAQAIVSEPEVLILDEPTVGLDPKQVAEIRDLVKSLKGHHTIILSTHILPEVEATCEKVIIINKGQIVAEDSIHNLSTMEKGQSRIHVRLRKEITDMKSVLSDISQVVSVHLGATSKEWDIDVQGGEEVVDMISSRIVGKGYGLIELSPSKLDLEDVFLKLTYGAEGKEGN
ncbi:ABC transporter ATP-binding protein [Bdellovibrio reynosensis]|uniref:ABC transporter ATP-binding protein n=1 Tax=Bdellovibrio reynosensis TaxID=2835041 RepID=A0ABY4CG93_9BACT|nr:ATP-binding cassette domain-containing protein [Bdellovibrio reynosensis]UOF02816.1 ABC transporter ATP-binding protein [Bdellovibrio reynosensis]